VTANPMSISIAMAADPMPATSAAAVHLDRQQFPARPARLWSGPCLAPSRSEYTKLHALLVRRGGPGRTSCRRAGFSFRAATASRSKSTASGCVFWNLRTKLFGKGFNKTFHDFRETTSTELSDAGCAENEIASIMGWVIGGEVPMSKNYVKRTRQLALNASTKAGCGLYRKGRCGADKRV
jgi:hypothetical protein